MFEKMAAAAADPILGLNDAFNQDIRSGKINLGVGVYKNEHGQTPVLNSVKKAEAALLQGETSKSYLGIQGNPDYGAAVQKLLLGSDSPIIQQQRACTANSPGGTGGLYIAAQLIARQLDHATVWLSDPSWANHASILAASGLDVATYRYYDADRKTLNFDAMLDDLQGMAAGDVLLVHGCCHNPTGVDPDAQQWEILAKFCGDKGVLPFFDFAYQGFGVGIEEDAQGLRLFAQYCDELIIASSFSKNFGIYNDRTGACTLVAKDADSATRAFSQLKRIIRAIYSNPPAHGSAVVTHVLGDDALRAEWEQELATMRNRIHAMRRLFVRNLKDKGVKQDFSFIEQQRGMFSFSGLNTEQVIKLREADAIYAVDSGRFNVAAMTESNMDALCAAIARVV